MTEVAQQKPLLDSFAVIVRAATVPPLMVAVFLSILFGGNEGVFSHISELALSLFFLAVVPLMAYPLSYLIPKIREKKRDGQRQLAFLFSFLGYLGAVIYGLVAKVTQPLQLIYFTYFFSVVVLIFFNKVLKVRVSGHACSLAGPLILLVYFIGLVAVVPCVLVGAVIAWASLRLRRHTPKELAGGSLCALAAFGISLLMFLL